MISCLLLSVVFASICLQVYGEEQNFYCPPAYHHGDTPDDEDNVCRNCPGVKCYIAAGRRADDHNVLGNFMSCSPFNAMPLPGDILQYLDCVMTGDPNYFNLFIYKPKYVFELVVADCIHNDFLDFLPKKTKLQSLELGFPFRALPQYFFLLHPEMLNTTKSVCFETSHLPKQIKVFELKLNGPYAKTDKIFFKPELESGVPPNVTTLTRCSMDGHILPNDASCHVTNRDLDRVSSGDAGALRKTATACNFVPFLSTDESMKDGTDEVPAYFYTTATLLLVTLVVMLISITVIVYYFRHHAKPQCFGKKKEEIEGQQSIHKKSQV